MIFSAFGLKYCQFFIPLGLGFSQQLIKITAVGLSMKVSQGSFSTRSRKRHFHLQGFRIRKAEISHNLATRHLREIPIDLELTPHAIVFWLLQLTIAIIDDGLIKTDGKIGVICPGPAIGDAVARQQRVVLHAKVGPKCLAVIIINGMLQIKDDAAVLAFGIGVAMYSDMLCSCELSLDAVIVKNHGVIAGMSLFCGMTIARAVTCIRIGLRSRIELDGTYNRHHQNIA